MKQDNREQDIAVKLDQAAFNSKAIEQISLKDDIDLEQSYAIQASSLQLRYDRGEILTGYKLGFTSKAKMEQMGVHEIIWGRLTNKMELKNNGVMQSKNFIHPRVEPEIAFKIGKCIDRPLAVHECLEYLDGVAAALEVIDSRYENFKFSLEDVIADNCSSSGYALGEWKPAGTPVHDVGISLYIDSEEVQQGNSNAILGNPLASLAEISRILTAQEIQIDPGMVILAGAATSAVFIHPGNKIKGSFGDLGEINFTVV